jgi:hypothetical protein
MAKSSGLGARFYVTGVDLSGDVGSLQTISTPRTVQDATGIDKSAMERIYLTRDGLVAYSTFFNPATAHPTLSALPTADQPLTYAHRATIGAPTASMVAKQINYDGTRNQDGSLGFAVQALANGYGLEWGELLTAGDDTLASAGAITGLDYGAGIGTTDFGLQAWLHVFDIDSGSATVAIQDSDDGGTDPWADVTGAVFTAASAGGTAQRLQTDRDESVKRWLRVNVTGTFTNLDFAVAVAKNLSAVVF